MFLGGLAVDAGKPNRSICGELSDDQWCMLRQRLRAKGGREESRQQETRQFIEAVLWIAMTGSVWKSLPESYGNAKTVSYRFHRWAQAYIWDMMIGLLANDPRAHALEKLLVRHRARSAKSRELLGSVR